MFTLLQYQMPWTWRRALLTRHAVRGYSSLQSPHKAVFQERLKTCLWTDTVTVFKIDDSRMNSSFGGTMIVCSVHGVLHFKSLKEAHSHEKKSMT